MKGSESKLIKYMEGADKQFVIPVYQRNYDWKIENCKQLYDDLIKVVRNSRKNHFGLENSLPLSVMITGNS